ncbi:MAG TPA: tetratricopeptide repeat protein [Vicinamibacterales bacterium]|nr:tetratricopeptide repeat protein [Vicinamibacterales bacterium]
MESFEPLSQTLTIGAAMSIGIECQKHGHVDQAEDIYRAILEQVPDHADAMHYLGVVVHQKGRHDEALALIEQSVALAPTQADWYSNLGIVLKARTKVDDAVSAFRRAIALDPRHVNAYNNLGVLLRAQGQIREAEASYRKAIELDPEHQDVHQNLGILLYGQRRMAEAVASFCRVITLDPRHAQALRLLCMAHCVLGEFDQAVAICERWVREQPGDPLAVHTLAACSGRDVPSRASDAYVEAVFDSFAASFDAKLTVLMYRAPQLVATMLAESGLEADGTRDVLDVGCGTGLCGPLLRQYAARLVGVDLSAKMLDQARERGVYDELVKGELTAFLRSCDEAYDAVVSADTLVYFGALDDVVAAAAGALRPGGHFVFTVEEFVGAGDGPDYCLRPHGRYNHARAYIERLLEGAGLRPVIARAELRLEAGAPVDGLVVRAEKRHAADTVRLPRALALQVGPSTVGEQHV